MSYSEILFLAIALSIDACVISFSYGLLFKENRLKNALLLAGFTGFFQFIMPVISYFLTDFVRIFISPYAPWIVFVIFMCLGLKFIIDAFNKNKSHPDCLTYSCLFFVALATSIDAFSAGISLSLLNIPILFPSVLIGLITFLNSLFGFFSANKLNSFPSRYLEIIGGLILILLAIKTIL